MSHLEDFLLTHGYAVLFGVVLAEQMGLPVPSTPLLLASGALVGLHQMNLGIVLALAVSASLTSDTIWFVLGKSRGGAILGTVCRVSLEPDTCVIKTRSVFTRYGPKSLLFAKFVPGLGTLGPPIAGMLAVAPWKFLFLDAGGALVWSGLYVSLGFLLRTQLEDLAAGLARFGSRFAIIIVSALVIFIAVKYAQRKRVYRALRTARVTPSELKRRMDAGEQLTIVDLRSPTEWTDGRIPGSLQFADQDLHSMPLEVTETEVILYCSCPNEAGSARAALRLKRKGVRRVRPLEGGFERWRDLGFPVENPASQATDGQSASGTSRAASIL